MQLKRPYYIKSYIKSPYYSLSLIFLFVSPVAAANEYVPPPTGPYQSSVVINTSEQESPQQTQVYKFPSTDLLQPTPLSEQWPTHDRPAKTEKKTKYLQLRKPANAPTQLESQQSNRPAMSAPPFKPAQPTYNPYSYDPYSYDPYSYDSYSYDPGATTRYWPEQGGSQQRDYRLYPYNQPYSYEGYSNDGYSNQKEFTNSPFQGMPSPWSTMPMKPFFSGNK